MTDSVDELLQWAGRGRLEGVVRLLEKRSVAVDARNHVGYTALMSAARSYRVEVVEYLLRAGANPNSRIEEGLSVLHFAVGGTPSQPERQAQCVRILIEAGGDPLYASPSGLTPLMNAGWFGCELAALELLRAGADVHARDRGGRTAADLAEQRGHGNLAAKLRRYGGRWTRVLRSLRLT